jgi:hypothetical protein
MATAQLEWTNFVIQCSDEEWAAVRQHWESVSDQIELELAAIAAGYKDFEEYLDDCDNYLERAESAQPW